MVEKLCRVRISAKPESSINLPFILSNDCLMCRPPSLDNIFQRDVDSNTEVLWVGFKALVEFISSVIQCPCVCKFSVFSGFSRRIVLIPRGFLGSQLKCE